MTQKKAKTTTEQDYIAQQRAFETAQLGRPTNGYANVQEMQEALRKKEEELHKLQLAHEETVHMLEQERREKEEEIDNTPYLRELGEVKQELARKESDLAGVRELNRKHVDTIRDLRNDTDEMMKNRETLVSRLDGKESEKRFLEELLGHILLKTDTKYHRASSKRRDRVAKAYAMPYNIVREYVGDETIRFFQDQYNARIERFKNGMKGMF